MAGGLGTEPSNDMHLWGEITLLATGHTNNMESETSLGTTGLTVLSGFRGPQGGGHWITLSDYERSITLPEGLLWA